MRLLAVDDDDVHLSLLALMLKDTPHEDVRFAGSAAEALELLSGPSVRFDCFLLDIDMPGMNGVDLCKEIRRLPGYQSAPILMLTRLLDREHMDAAFAAGATDYVTKPVEQFELTSRLRLAQEFLQQKQRLDAMGAEVEAANRERKVQEHVDLSTRLALDDVLGAVDYLAFENFLFRSSVQTRNMYIFAVKVANVSEIFRVANSADFSFVMNCVGDAIAEVLKQRQFFLTYAGNGVFPIALRDGLGLDLEDFAMELYGQAPDLEIGFADGQEVQAELAIGAPIKSAFFPRKANLQALTAAIANAEEAAVQQRYPESDQAGHDSSFMSPLLGILKAS